MEPDLSSPRPRLPRGRAVLVVLVLAVVLALRPVRAHMRAASLLLRFADEHATGTVASFGRTEIVEEPAVVETAHGPAPARIYRPRDAGDTPGIVVVHGVHRLGIEEPRMVRFARAIAATGVVVLTPEVEEIADYRIDPRSIDTIGAAAMELEKRTGKKPGVMGMSFAGGLALLAAADPRFAGHVGFVVAIGAHHDLARVSRFFATNEVKHPDGTTSHLEAHGYGVLVLAYGRAEQFFAPEDVAAARDTIRLWLWDDRTAARARARDLSPAGAAKMTLLLDGPIEKIAPELLADVDREQEDMKQVSPSGHLGGMTVPVFLLHGAGDTVIPAAETEWIAREVPPAVLRNALVSPAIVHVELGAETPASQKWALVHFMAGVLQEAEDAQDAGTAR